MKKTITLLSFICFAIGFANAQDEPSLLELLDDNQAEPNLVYATFKGTRLINFHTLEVPGTRTLDFRIAHRFGPFNDGAHNFFGLDGPASIRLSLEYSYDGRLCTGIGRSNVDKTFDGFLKYRLLRQTDGGGAPVSLTLFTSAFLTSLNDDEDGIAGAEKYAEFSHRLSFCHQAIVGRKFGERFSLQLAPTVVHYNLVDRPDDENDVYILAAATRFKITQRTAITAEYGLRLNDYTDTDYYDSFGIGVDVETGGHVFQMHITNSFGLTENQYFPRTSTKWGDMGIRLGFNISRVFTI
jgi:hypothetical protein